MFLYIVNNRSQFRNKPIMKSLANDNRISELNNKPEQSTPILNSKQTWASSHRKLQQLQQQNIEYESTIKLLQLQIQKLQQSNSTLDVDLAAKRKQLQQAKQQLEEQQQKDQGQEGPQLAQQQNQMHNWITHVQNYSGVSQEVIDGLLVLEYQAGADQNQICLSCYQPMQVGVQCKYLPCAHLFHVDCINNHLKVNKLCPGCGEPVAQ